MYLNARGIREIWKNVQELKNLEEAKILSMSWRSLKNQSIGDLPKNLAEVKNVEEVKNLRNRERKHRQPGRFGGLGKGLPSSYG
jgi:hypothetical protein